jgi:predicted glycoside hydrolase/deacetylase ChbG (UPF0249 family)
MELLDQNKGCNSQLKSWHGDDKNFNILSSYSVKINHLTLKGVLMQPNPVLKKLGFSNTDRVVIIHTDDIGMCQASIDAFAEMVDFGLISSGAVMMPCPWALSAARYARLNPQADLGIHLTLTSEWEIYRWGPLSTRSRATGLLDDQGFFPRTSAQVQATAEPDAVEEELTSQISLAIAEGINPTHIDTHMGSVAHPKFIQIYIKLAIQFGLPLMLPRLSEAEWVAYGGIDPQIAAMATQLVNSLEEAGIPLFDGLSGLGLEHAQDRLEQAKAALSALKPGITHFIIHPSKDTPELRQITDSWACRVADYETFTKSATRQYIEEQGIQVIGYQALKNLMPQS